MEAEAEGSPIAVSSFWKNRVPLHNLLKREAVATDYRLSKNAQFRKTGIFSVASCALWGLSEPPEPQRLRDHPWVMAAMGAVSMSALLTAVLPKTRAMSKTVGSQ